MVMTIERPYSGANFLVTIGDADSHSAAAGFAEVIFPPFVADAERERGSDRGHAEDDASSGPSARRLVLRRGVIGSLDLYAWWDETRRAKKPATRLVTIELLADDRRTVVMAWRFHRAYPVSISYSPLRANEGAIVTETVELAFERVEIE
jgi:phage tail-like protein